VETLDYPDLTGYVKAHSYLVNQAALDDGVWSLVDEETQALLEKIRGAGVPLGEYVEGKIYYGIKTGLNAAFVIDEATRERLIAEDPRSAEVIKPFLAGRDVKRYLTPDPAKFLILFEKGWTDRHAGSVSDKWDWLKDTYPAITSHLELFSEKGERRYDKGDYWWELRACDYYQEFERPKIMYAEIATRGQFTIDDGNHYSDTTSYIIGSNSPYLVGILNSRLWTFLFSNVSSEIRGGFFRWKRQYMESLPIHPIDPASPADVARRDRIVALVEDLLVLNKRLAGDVAREERAHLETECARADAEIDRIVYELYGLTEEEIAVVEGVV
jgi:hypothetical protein